MQITKQQLLDRLRAAGVAHVHVEYSGYSDEGIVDRPTLYDHADRPLRASDLDSYGELAEQICDFVYAQLQQHSPGWELNGGAAGSVAITVAARTVQFDHGLYTEPELISRPFEV